MMKRTMFAVLSMSLVACVGAAPGGGDGNGGGKGDGTGGGGGGGGGGGATAAQVIEKMVKVDCDQAFACKASFPTNAGVTFEEAFGATPSACYADGAEYYDVSAVQAAITAGKIDFDASAASACISGLNGLATPACSTYWNEGPAYPDACIDVFTGKVADGASCTTDFECANPASYCEGTCKADTAGRTARVDGIVTRPKLQLLAR